MSVNNDCSFVGNDGLICKPHTSEHFISISDYSFTSVYRRAFVFVFIFVLPARLLLTYFHYCTVHCSNTRATTRIPPPSLSSCALLLGSF